jgi:hypothetical protein
MIFHDPADINLNQPTANDIILHELNIQLQDQEAIDCSCEGINIVDGRAGCD